MASLLRLRTALSLVVLALPALHRSQERAERVNIIRERATHSARLERWLGAEQCELLSASMRDWYGPPIAIAGVPGAVRVHKGGDFRGISLAGRVASLLDYAEDVARRYARSQRAQANFGFTALSEVIKAATTPERMRTFYWTKRMNLSGNPPRSLWKNDGHPEAGAAASAAPDGRVPTSATAGAIPYADLSGDMYLAANTLVFGETSVANLGGALLLYDRIFDVAKTMNSTVTESVTGVPTRYQNQGAGTEDYIGGNFLFIEVHNALGAGAHQWTECKYLNQAGAPATLPAVTGVSSNPAGALDRSVVTASAQADQWYVPLATDDAGIGALIQMQCSAAITGAVNFVIGHPIAFMPKLVANQALPFDLLNQQTSLRRVFSSAALAFSHWGSNSGGEYVSGTLTLLARNG